MPDRISSVISSRLSIDRLCELRIRNSLPVCVLYDGCYYFLCRSGLTKDRNDAFIAEKNEAERVVMRACEKSLYTVTETLKRGYIAVSGGIRIGVCGSAVTERGAVFAVKDFSSVNIRVPHQVKGCAATLYNKIASDRIPNTLIISPPGAGKTTVLRDLCRMISDRGKNVLLCDEKYEIAAAVSGAPTLDVGACTDVISGTDKETVFNMGVASMRPDVIAVDELFNSDIDGLSHAVHCGISVIATVHARDLIDFKSKREYSEILNDGIFSRFAVLSDAPRRGIAVYDGECAI